jgi:hypothetical protein
VFYALNVESSLFEKSPEILVLKEAGVEVRVAGARIRDTAEESAVGAESAANLLQNVVWIHQMLERFEADDDVERIIRKRETVGADIEALAAQARSSAAINPRRRGIYPYGIKVAVCKKLKHSAITAANFQDLARI